MQDQHFQQPISKVLFLSQIFSILPVSNVLARDVKDMRFSWISIVSIYSALILILNACEFGTVINLVLKDGLNFHTSATKWSYIMRCWHQTEQLFLRPPYRLYAKTFNMKRRIYILTFIVLFSALVEHCMLLFNSFHKSELERTQCHLNISYWESLYRRERFHLYVVLPFHIWLLPFLEWINLSLAYSRSFTDAFIICISIGLTFRFRQLYLRIQAVHMKAMPSYFWSEIRQHYLALRQLVHMVNNAIAPLVLLACTNNMYFICFQLFNSFQNIGVDLIAMLAFWYSLLFAIARTMLTVYIASAFNDITKRMLSLLRDVPSKSWSMEVQRLCEQLAVDLTALSGNGFFFLTRKLMLAMASTIVTYELMVTDVINKGSIQQRTDYCSSYWLDSSSSQSVEVSTEENSYI